MIRTSPNRLLGTVLGVVYLLVGLAGFTVTDGVAFAASTGATLAVFEVNPLHNLVHLAVGATLLVGGRATAAARTANTGVGALYLLVGLGGLVLLDSPANLLALNGADNGLHLASALLLLGVGLTADRRPRSRAGTRPRVMAA